MMEISLDGTDELLVIEAMRVTLLLVSALEVILSLPFLSNELFSMLVPFLFVIFFFL